ncbi:hypothetical protein [Nocardioides mangrovi]|uniref:Sulfotransferase family protein n=1 Tax=Nocardioides mangrovi TaxID=2874580 RepID=A0ABS7U8J5_9ACTN|nr:hypothetical protein [Nocardioides mangrovi]MBZ5737298.1 hypothetical protein [Nocardioides mangrovi]
MADPRRLYLHVGLQKTGTSYLQAALLAGADGLAAQGLDLVPPSKRECFELMVVVRNRYESRRDEESDRNIVERFRAQLDRATGSRAVFSQESLAGAGPGQIVRLLEMCGDREVHVVVTVRDLARQLPSSWQEHVKAGGTARLERYLRKLQRLEEAGRLKQPWIHLDAAGVLRRWSKALGPERMHLVTVPPPGSPLTLLLERFSSVLEVDPGLLVPEDRPSNSSLGRVQVDLLRRVNAELPDEVHRRYVYNDVVKRSFGTQVLGRQAGERSLVPAEFRAWCEAAAERQIAALAAAGYRVEGSLDDLRCPDAAFDIGSGRPRERDVAASAVSALATLLAERGETEAERRTGAIRVDRPGVLDRLRPRRTGRSTAAE